MTSSCRSGHAPADRGRLSDDSSANTDATRRPTVVDAVQPRLVTSISTIGVVSACTAKKPALAMNAHATRKMRASSWVCAAWAIRTPIPPAMSAVVSDQAEVGVVVLPPDVGARLGEQQPETEDGQGEVHAPRPRAATARTAGG